MCLVLGYGKCAEEYEGRDPMENLLLSFATAVTLESMTQVQSVGAAIAPE
jgi:hypothetical protein